MAWRSCSPAWRRSKRRMKNGFCFLYAYPNKVTQKLLDTIAEHDALVKYIDHASAARERSGVEAHEARCEQVIYSSKLIERYPQDHSRRWHSHQHDRQGFPGETDRDFDELCQFVQAAQFDRLGVFSYSDEDTSKSFDLDGKVDARTIYNRKRHLMSLASARSRAPRIAPLIGREFRVLVEEPHRGFRN